MVLRYRKKCTQTFIFKRSNKMDFVYTCRDGENEELRYSIRSVVKNYEDANIWVVGGKPDWYVGNYIPVKQASNSHTNQFHNLLTACNSDQISNNFILMNDDFFIINKIKNIDHFYGGLLKDKINLYMDLTGDTIYVRRLVQTLDRLNKYGIDDPLDYELHVPFPVEKDKFKMVLEKDGRFNWRSIYGNKFNVGGKQTVDVKVYDSGNLQKKSFDYKNIKSDFLSSLDESFVELEPLLKKIFKKRTKYEK